VDWKGSCRDLYPVSPAAHNLIAVGHHPQSQHSTRHLLSAGNAPREGERTLSPDKVRSLPSGPHRVCQFIDMEKVGSFCNRQDFSAMRPKVTPQCKNRT
jgi:hypothetical protein